MLTLWIFVFFVSLALLVKGADWLIASAEKIGLAFGLSPFVVGVVIVGIGTSFPELVSSFAAVWHGVTDVVAANAIGSNIANILLVVGASAVVGRKLVVTKDLINLDLPLLAVSAVLLIGVVWDGQVTLGESILLVVGYVAYMLYTVFHKDDEADSTLLPEGLQTHPKIVLKDIAFLVVGTLGLVFGAQYLIESLVQLSTMLDIGTGVIAITAVAIGTSLPELLVSIKAALKGKSEVALGNIFGSNIFNGFMVIGLPGLIRPLMVDAQTLLVGVPTMVAATFLFVISGMSRRIYIWEGIFFLLLYILFIAKLFSWF